MPPTLRKEGDALELELTGCRGFEFDEAKAKIKEVPGRRWNAEKKVWTVPADPANADRILKTIRPDADDDLLAWVRESMKGAEESLTTAMPPDALRPMRLAWATKRMPWQPETVNDEEFTGLLPYQRSAVELMAKNARAILADDMGLGKTIEAVAAVEEFSLQNGQADGPRLVVAPSSVLGSWKRELERWLDNPKVVVVDGKLAAPKRAEAIQQGIKDNAWIVVNWEQLRVEKKKRKTRNGGSKTETVMKQPLFGDTEWLAVIADEVHKAKNKDAAQTRGLWRCRGEIMLGLTGTPIMNSPDELWSILRWLWPDEYHERGAAYNDGAIAYWDFYMDYVDHYEDHFKRKVVTGVRNPDALRFVLKGKLIRRTASILGLKGRKRIKYPVPLNPGQQKLYDEAERAMWLAVEQEIAEGNKAALQFAQAAISGGGTANLLRIPNGAARLVRLQQIIENAALLGGSDDSAVMDDFMEKFEESGFAQWVVFCKYKESCNILAERIKKLDSDLRVAVYNGDVKPADRTDIEDEFQKGQLDVVVGTIDAMYQGITLTSGRRQFWLSRDFVPARNEQGEARNDRLGQQELVLVYIPQAEDTVAADKVDPINRLKESIVRTVVPQDKIKEVDSHA